MRTLAFVVAALALGACGQAERETADGDCAVSVTREIAWPQGEPRLNVVASTSGETCAAATATLELRAGDGRVLHSVAAPYYALIVGGEAPANAAPIAREDVERFLNSWSDIDAAPGNAMPAWPEGAANPGESTPLSYRSPLSRDAYEAYRSAAAPVACIAVRVDAVECIVIDAQGNAQIMVGIG